MEEIGIFTIAREELGISQRELARLTGVHHSVIARIENGEIEQPSLNVLLKLCKTLQISFADTLIYYGYIVDDLSDIGIIKTTPVYVSDEKTKKLYKSFYEKYKNDLESAFIDYKNGKLDLKELNVIINLVVGIDLTKYTKK